MRKKKDLPDPLKPGNIPGQNPATPERMPGHTQFYEQPADEHSTIRGDEQDDELDEALERTFPASDPVSLASPLINRSPKSRRRGED
jgi:hypothetical protein